jgi:hypothetical protein
LGYFSIYLPLNIRKQATGPEILALPDMSGKIIGGKSSGEVHSRFASLAPIDGNQAVVGVIPPPSPRARFARALVAFLCVMFHTTTVKVRAKRTRETGISPGKRDQSLKRAIGKNVERSWGLTPQTSLARLARLARIFVCRVVGISSLRLLFSRRRRDTEAYASVSGIPDNHQTFFVLRKLPMR